MLLVHTFLDKSPIQGLGVFAKRAIGKGTPVWQLDLRFDRLIEVEVYEGLSGPAKDYLDRYAYPHRGEELPVVPQLGDAMRKGVDALPTLEDSESRV